MVSWEGDSGTARAAPPARTSGALPISDHCRLRAGDSRRRNLRRHRIGLHSRIRSARACHRDRRILRFTVECPQAASSRDHALRDRSGSRRGRDRAAPRRRAHQVVRREPGSRTARHTRGARPSSLARRWAVSDSGCRRNRIDSEHAAGGCACRPHFRSAVGCRSRDRRPRRSRPGARGSTDDSRRASRHRRDRPARVCPGDRPRNRRPARTEALPVTLLAVGELCTLRPVAR